MLIHQLRTTAGASLFCLAAALAAPSASAAIVTGSWDPALPNPPFDNLGWTTTVNLQISDDCSSGAQSLPFIVNLFGRSFGCRTNPFASSSPFSILSAEIGIYDLTSELIVDVLTFDPGSFVPFLVDLGTGGAITYLLSLTDSNAVRGDIDRTEGFEFKLALPGAAPAIKYRAFGTEGAFITAEGVPLETAFAINPDSAQAAVLAQTRLVVGTPVFTAQIPEPGTLALVALALGVAGAAGSRRRS
jgi:hypothetical protein